MGKKWGGGEILGKGCRGPIFGIDKKRFNTLLLKVENSTIPKQRRKEKEG